MRFFWILLMAACDGGSDDELGDKGDGDTGGCSTTGSGDVAPSESPLGFSIDEWLAVNGGNWAGTLTTSSTSDDATASIAFPGDTVHWEANTCGDTYQLDLDVQLQAGEGVLDEALVMDTRVDSESASLSWKGTELTGSLVTDEPTEIEVRGDLHDGALTFEVIAVTRSDMGGGVGSESRDSAGELDLTHE